jgi:methionyl-tRNA synthetase
MATLARQLVRQAVCLAPFTPGKAQALWEQLGGPAAGHARVEAVAFDALDALDPAGWRVSKRAPLFPRAEPRAEAGGGG